jgi:hypothetical protein
MDTIVIIARDPVPVKSGPTSNKVFTNASEGAGLRLHLPLGHATAC